MFLGWRRCIICIDMNAFFASIEQKMQPELRRQAVAITNGDKGSCIITCSYEARLFGIHTGMHVREALMRCPDLKLCASRPTLYASISSEIMRVLKDFTPDIEVFSVDEAFLDMTRVRNISQTPEVLAQLVQQKIWKTVGLPLSVGISGDKTLAKYAAKSKKPMGVTVIEPNKARQILSTLPVHELCGIGHGIERFLAQYGAHSCGDVAKLPVSVLANRFGYMGRRIWLMCQGRDPDPVKVYTQSPKSMGHGKVLPPGSRGKTMIMRYLHAMAFKLSVRMHQDNLWTSLLVISVRYSYKGWYSIRYPLSEGVQDYDTFIEYIQFSMQGVLMNDPIRQVHVAALKLQEHCQKDWLEVRKVQTPRDVSRVMQSINQRFGMGCIQPARLSFQRSPDVISPAWRPEKNMLLLDAKN